MASLPKLAQTSPFLGLPETQAKPEFLSIKMNKGRSRFINQLLQETFSVRHSFSLDKALEHYSYGLLGKKIQFCFFPHQNLVCDISILNHVSFLIISVGHEKFCQPLERRINNK